MSHATKNPSGTATECIIGLLRENNDQTTMLKIEEIAKNLSYHPALVSHIMKGLSDRNIVEVSRCARESTGTRGKVKNQYKINAEFQEGDSWQELMKGFWGRIKNRRPIPQVTNDLNLSMLTPPAPEPKDLKTIARMAEAFATMQSLSAKRKRLFDALPTIDNTADLDDQSRLIKQTERELGEAEKTFSQLRSVTLKSLQEQEFAEKFLELTFWLYAQSLEVEKLMAEKRELEEERGRLLKDNAQQANDIATLELALRKNQQRQVSFDNSGVQVTGSHS